MILIDRTTDFKQQQLFSNNNNSCPTTVYLYSLQFKLVPHRLGI